MGVGGTMPGERAWLAPGDAWSLRPIAPGPRLDQWPDKGCGQRFRGQRFLPVSSCLLQRVLSALASWPARPLHGIHRNRPAGHGIEMKTSFDTILPTRVPGAMLFKWHPSADV